MAETTTKRNMRMSAKLMTDAQLGEFVEVKMIVNHPMETGRKKDDFGQLIAAHFIQVLTVTSNEIGRAHV